MFIDSLVFIYPIMKNLESNKIIASILLSGLIAMLCSFLTDIFYKPDYSQEKRGYEVVIEDTQAASSKGNTPEEIDMSKIMLLADLNKGKSLSKKCTSCHSFNQGGPNKIGPNLWNIMNSDIASKSNYNYSKALASLEGNWNYDAMYQFINKPKKYAPGTKMSFGGLKKQKDIASMIVFLRSNSENPLPLPN